MLEKLFHLKDRQTTVRVEFIAGVTTFLTMAYVIFVIPATLQTTGMDKEALIAATCLVAAISTLMMGFAANVPIALAPGMGLNAFFAYTLVITYGIGWQTALGIVFWGGVLFLLLSLVGIREKIMNAIPAAIVTAIPVGIGLFLLFIGLQNMGVIVDNPATLVMLGKFTPAVVIGLVGLFLTIILLIKKVKGAILIGIVVSTLLALIAGLVNPPQTVVSLNVNVEPIAFKLDILGALKLSLIGPVFALFYINMFDSLGTLVACSTEAGLVQPDGKIKNINRMLVIDAFSTVLSGLLGTSPATAYIESATGIAEGGKTGLTAIITGLLFIIALAFIPLISVVPAYATAPSLIIVGILMVSQIRHINFDIWEESIPAIFTLVMMPLSFSIATGMACGFLSWGIIKMLLFKFREISLIFYLIMVVSVVSLLL